MIAPSLNTLPELVFTSVRLKFTAWYLFIIMAVSTVFSFALYTGINNELLRFERLTVVRKEQDFFGTRIQRVPAFDPEMISDSRSKLVFTLILINLGILAVAGVTGYILAGKTLKPIEDMLEEQKRFTADASHELRTPLTAMKTEIEVALRDKNLSLLESKRLLKSNLEETEKMQALSNHLLTLSRYQNTKGDFTKEKFNVTELIEEVEAGLKAAAAKKHIKISAPKQLVEIEANRDSLKELLTILIDNAIKYSKDKGEVIVKAQKKGNRVQISVQDFGVGIKPNDIPHIFDRFYRADSSRSEKEGYGLGLSIAKSIVDLHDGKIEVKSTPGQGSTFIVLI